MSKVVRHSEKSSLRLFLRYIRGTGIIALLLGGIGLIMTYFELSVALVYFGLLLLGIDIYFEPTLKRHKLIHSIGLGIVGPAILLFTSFIVFVPGHLDIHIMSDVYNYPDGTIINGIKWTNSYAEVRINLSNPTDRDYKDLDLIIDNSLKILEIGQITNIPEVRFERITPFHIFGPVFGISKGSNGNETTNPLTFIHITSKYRIWCSVLPRYSNIELVLAVGDENQPHVRQVPNWIKINGIYHDFGRDRNVMYQFSINR